MAASLKGQDLVCAEECQLHRAVDYGGLAVLNDAWSRFQLEGLLKSLGSARQRGLIKAVIFSRLLFPCAKLSLAQKAQGTWLAQACGLDPEEAFDEDDIYEAMDQLNGQWVRMEKQLYHSAFPQAVRLVLYDLTSVYFEGKGPKFLARYGHSRDHRADRPQIILAVATDTQGLPLHVSILRGNRNDTKTLQGLLHALRRRFGITEATFVFDGGMSSRINLEAMDKAGLGYVTRLSASTLQNLADEVGLEKQLELGDDQRLIEITHESKRYVLVGGPWRQQRDQERRQCRIGKAEKGVETHGRAQTQEGGRPEALQPGGPCAPRAPSRTFTYRVEASGQLHWERKADLIAQEAQQDGWYLLHTNETVERCSGEQVLGHYKGLLEVEEAFCELKSYLEVRPVHHHRPDRVINHVRLCFLGYWMSARLSGEWRAKGVKEEVPRILRQLQTIRLGHLQTGQHVHTTLMTQGDPKEPERAVAEAGIDAVVCRTAKVVARQK